MRKIYTKAVRNQNGASILLVILIIMAIGLAAGTGWFVYNKQQKSEEKTVMPQSSDSEPKENAQQSQDVRIQDSVADESDNWVELTSANKVFSIKVPDGWTIDNLSTTDEVHIKNNKNLVYVQGKPATINTISPNDSYVMAPSYFWIVVTSQQQCSTESQNNISVAGFILRNGAKGIRYSGEFEDILDGTGINVQQCYSFQKGDKFYTVTYRRLKTDTDNSAVVEKSVKTLSF